MSSNKKTFSVNKHKQGQVEIGKSSIFSSSKGKNGAKGISQSKKVNGVQNSSITPQKPNKVEGKLDSHSNTDKSSTNIDKEPIENKINGKESSHKKAKKSNEINSTSSLNSNLENENKIPEQLENEDIGYQKKLDINTLLEKFNSLSDEEEEEEEEEKADSNAADALLDVIKNSLKKQNMKKLISTLSVYSRAVVSETVLKFDVKTAKSILGVVLDLINNNTLNLRAYLLWAKNICRYFPSAVKEKTALHQKLTTFLMANENRMETQKALLKLTSRIQLIFSQRSQQVHLKSEFASLEASLNASERHNEKVLDGIELMDKSEVEEDEEDEETEMSAKNDMSYVEDFDNNYSSDFEEELDLDTNSKRKYQEVSDSE